MATAMTNDTPFGSGESCPYCGAENFPCEHLALTFVPGDSIGGGAAFDEARAFLVALDNALVDAATDGATLVAGICRDLCLEAAKLGRRRVDPVDPENVPAELGLARWELLEEVVARTPADVRECVVVYGGFCAEDSGRVAYALDVERVRALLREEIAALSGSLSEGFAR